MGTVGLIVSLIMVFIAGIIFGIYLSAGVIIKDLKGDKKLFKKWNEKYGRQKGA